MRYVIKSRLRKQQTVMVIYSGVVFILDKKSTHDGRFNYVVSLITEPQVLILQLAVLLLAIFHIGCISTMRIQGR